MMMRSEFCQPPSVSSSFLMPVGTPVMAPSSILSAFSAIFCAISRRALCVMEPNSLLSRLKLLSMMLNNSVSALSISSITSDGPS